ncbi:MAG TPA: hypothetical protein VJB92_00035 [Candidatus Paceibacterota bacterium]
MNRFVKTLLISFGALFLVAGPLSTSAHVEAEPQSLQSEITAMIVEPDLFIAGAPTPVFLEIKSHDLKKAMAGLKVKIAIEDFEGKQIFEDRAIERGDNYVFEYAFPKSGEYTIHADFNYGGQDQDFDFEIFVSEPEKKSLDIAWLVFLITGVLALIALGLGLKTKNMKAAIIWPVIIILAGVLAYSLYVTLKANPSAGVVTCVASGECFWTAHVHAFVPISICGEEFRLPIEKGALGGPHTHEEKNTIHWHDRLPYDKKTQSITETEPLTLGAFFDALEIQFNDQSIAEKINGGRCSDGAIGSIKIFANGELITNARNHIWKDKDVIAIFFDSRSAPEIEAELKAKPIVFPKLGRG